MWFLIYKFANIALKPLFAEVLDLLISAGRNGIILIVILILVLY